MRGSNRFDQDNPPPTPNSRRRFLQTGIAGVAAAVAASSGLNLANSNAVLARGPMTPATALQRLMDGNRRFVDDKTTAREQDVKALRRSLETTQDPYAAVLTCADSRIPVEMVFDETIGQLFVARVAGNMMTPEIVASLEYGVAVLSTKVILVLGHSNCGAVKAAIAGKSVPGSISSLYPYLRPAVDQAGPDAKAVTRTNAKIQAHLLSQASPVVAEKIKEGQLKVVAGYYDIGSGAVTVLE